MNIFDISSSLEEKKARETEGVGTNENIHHS